jgi:hypothetical protein
MENQEGYVFYQYTRNGVVYTTPDLELAHRRAEGDVYSYTYDPQEINAPWCN